MPASQDEAIVRHWQPSLRLHDSCRKAGGMIYAIGATCLMPIPRWEVLSEMLHRLPVRPASRKAGRGLDAQPPVLALDPGVPPPPGRLHAHAHPLADEHGLQVHVLEVPDEGRELPLGEGGLAQGGQHEGEQQRAVDQGRGVALGGAAVGRVQVDGVGVEAEGREAEEDRRRGREGDDVRWVLVDFWFSPHLE